MTTYIVAWLESSFDISQKKNPKFSCEMSMIKQNSIQTQKLLIRRFPDPQSLRIQERFRIENSVNRQRRFLGGFVTQLFWQFGVTLQTPQIVFLNLQKIEISNPPLPPLPPHHITHPYHHIQFWHKHNEHNSRAFKSLTKRAWKYCKLWIYGVRSTCKLASKKIL